MTGVEQQVTSLARQVETAVREVWLMDEEQDGHWHRAATFPLGPSVQGRG